MILWRQIRERCLKNTRIKSMFSGWRRINKAKFIIPHMWETEEEGMTEGSGWWMEKGSREMSNEYKWRLYRRSLEWEFYISCKSFEPQWHKNLKNDLNFRPSFCSSSFKVPCKISIGNEDILHFQKKWNERVTSEGFDNFLWAKV